MEMREERVSEHKQRTREQRTERRKTAEELNRDVWNTIKGLTFVPLESQKERRK